MNLEKYTYKTTNDFLDYEFNSIGPKGSIKKIVRYSIRFSSNNQPFYNLGFGDWDEEKRQINDIINSGNDDRERILATVASTVIDFTNRYPEMPVYVEGSTPSRIRLYQMMLNKYIYEIVPIFNIFGLVSNVGWQRFQAGVNYDALLVFRK